MARYEDVSYTALKKLIVGTAVMRSNKPSRANESLLLDEKIPSLSFPE